MAGWVGAGSELLTPLVDALRAHIFAGGKIHADDTPMPMLAPGTGKTKTDRLWTYVRDDRPACELFRQPNLMGTSDAYGASDLRGAFRIHRSTVCSEASKSSIFNLLGMRGAPQVGISAAIRQMSSRNFLPTYFLPARFRCRQSHVQYTLNPALCRRTTASG